ncbi:MAG TPA: ABC transporter permease [Aggregatilineaceae bacterium]|nr:ABC transporter permease [Aggregatilineaceae bacterium]
MPLYLYIVRRLLLMIPLLIGITLLSFVIAHAIPSDPLVANLGQHGMSDPQTVAAFKAKWGLDQPVTTQYLVYLRNLLSGDLGTSIRSHRPILDDLKSYLPATIELATFATVFGVLFGLLLGLLASVWRNSIIDFASRFVSLIGISAPVFWLALITLAVFYVQLRWVPGLGRLDAGLTRPPTVTGFLTVDSLLAGDWNAFTNALGHLILPGLVLGSYSMGLITRMTRSSMLETLTQDYVRTARGKGLGERVIVLRHAFSNAVIPVITVIGISYGTLLSGAVLTETIFAWPGIGRYAYSASTTLDFPAIMGVSLTIALIFTIINLLTDVIYYFADPRIRAQ